MGMSRKTPFHSMTRMDMERAEREAFTRAFDEREREELEAERPEPWLEDDRDSEEPPF